MRAVYGDEGLLKCAPVQDLLSVTVFVKWSRKRLCTMVRTTFPSRSKKVAPCVLPVVKSDMPCPSQVAKWGPERDRDSDAHGSPDGRT